MLGKNIELVSGVGDYPSLKAAINAKADSVYFGIQGLNMRDFGKNFELKDLSKIVKFCHDNKVKAYLALNTIVYDEEIKFIRKILKLAKKNKIDGIICSDLLVLQEAKKLNLDIHISTQMSVSNLESINLLKKLGAKRVVLARELNLEQIKNISKKSKLEIEVFVHGSLCIAVSGRCFLSLYFHDRSANRGRCVQPCRRLWKLESSEESAEMYENQIISSKDLCTLDFLDKLINSKIKVLKIEGRTKGPDYIYVVTKVYKEAINLIKNNKFTKKKKEELLKELSSVFNRGFTSGFYFRKPDYNDITTSKKSERTKKQICIGRIKKYYSKINVVEFNADVDFKLGEEIIIKGAKTYFRQKIESIEVNNKVVVNVKRNDDVCIKVIDKVRKNDLIYALR